jgi:hypothetical protein
VRREASSSGSHESDFTSRLTIPLVRKDQLINPSTAKVGRVHTNAEVTQGVVEKTYTCSPIQGLRQFIDRAI